MSTTTVDTAPDEAQVARGQYDRMLAETRKFSAEQNKLAAEAAKLSAEQNKLAAEAAKLNRDRRLAPLVLLASIGGGGIVALLTWALNNYKLFIPHG